ncbi:MAG: substrate-binding domain-containing protein [Fastidiosipilaceae bacterium]
MKKRIFALAIAAVMAVSLVACGGGSKEETTVAEKTTAAAEETTAADAEETTAAAADDELDSSAQLAKLESVKPNKEGFKLGLALGWRDEFGSKLEAAIEAEAKALGLSVTSVDANSNANTQIGQIQQFAGQGVDAIVTKLVTTDMGKEVLAAAGDVPVAFVNINPDDDLTGTGSTKVGSNNLEAGSLQGEFLADFFTKKGVDNVRYVMMQGTLGLSYTTERTNGSQDALKAVFPNAEMVYDDTGEYDRAKAQNKMQTFLGTGKEFDAVICNNDEMAIGCIVAMEAVGIDPQEVPVVGIDGTPAGLDSMESGGISMTVYQDAVGQGSTAVRAAVALANGDDVNSNIYVPFIPITPDNMAEFK